MLSNKDATGTSWHGQIWTATYNDMVKAIGEPQYSGNDGRDKVNYEWTCELPTGEVYTIYDWKYYRPLKDDEMIEWHIGARDAYTAICAIASMI